jgi:type II secretory ATPase GspE/PulE/Tfp pilus assembly ATPase PilB-like protein
MHYELAQIAKQTISPSYDPSGEILAQKPWETLASCSSIKARQFLNYDLAIRFNILPLTTIDLGTGRSQLYLATTEIPDFKVVSDLKFATGCDLEFDHVKLDRGTLEKAIHSAYLGRNYNLEKDLPDIARGELPVVHLLNRILDNAISSSASDIHIEPSGDCCRLRYRIDGRLQEKLSQGITEELATSISRRIKILAKLNSTENRLPQEGGFSYQLGQTNLRLRVSIIPQQGNNHGEKIVIRVLENNFLTALSEKQIIKNPFAAIGLDSFQQKIIIAALESGSGSILLSGPTGSGKSTFLYTMLNYLNSPDKNLVSIEDPVERLIPGINQTQINPKIGLDYSSLLKSMLRQDPDVIAIGEIRDSETANVALTAGISGHLMLSTAHAGNCLEILLRLKLLGIKYELMAMSLRLLSSQRLVPANCPNCLEAHLLTEQLKRIFKIENNVEKFFTAQGCQHCHGSGINGRVGFYELLPITKEIKDLLANYDHSKNSKHNFSQKLSSVAKEFCFHPLFFQAKKAMLDGRISPPEALKIIGIPPQFAGF